MVFTALKVLPLAVLPFVLISSQSLGVTWKNSSSLRAGWYKTSARTPVFSGSGVVAKLANRTIASDAARSQAAFAAEVKKYGKPRYQNELGISFTVGIARPEMISVLITTFSDTAGAHPNTLISGLTFGIKGGKASRLLITDMILSGSEPMEDLQALLLALLLKQKAMWVMDGTVRKIDSDSLNSFVVTPAGLTWVFHPYAMGPYVEGTFTIKVPWIDLHSIIDPEGPLGRFVH